MLQILFLAPITANKYSWQTIILLGLLFLFPVIYGFALFSTYNDGMIGIIFSSTIMIFILSHDKYKSLYLISPIIAFMPLFREIGIVLAQLAVLMMLVTLWIANNTENQKKRKCYIWFFIALVILPYLMQYMWFEYIASNNVMVGRKGHNLRHLYSILSIYDADSKTLPIIIAYIKALGKIFISPLFVLMYILQIASWFSVTKFGDNKTKREFKILFLASIICFIIFLTWRLYIYLLLASSVYSSDNDLINLKCMNRYIISYGVIFFSIPCAFLKITILDKCSNRYNKIIVSVILFTVIILSNVLYLKKVRIKDLSLSERILRSQTDIVKDFALMNFVINYDFTFDKIADDRSKELVCTKTIALLVPFANNDLRNRCINQYPSEIEKLKVQENQTNSNVDLKDIGKIYGKDRCKIIYRPLINNLDINCS